MPNNPDAGSAFLVDPMGAHPERLDEDEYGKLRNVLDVSRDESKQSLWRMLSWLLHLSTTAGPGLYAVLTNAVYHFLAEIDDDGAGVLAERSGPGIAILSDEEITFLQQALVAHRAGGWFQEWLEVQLKTIAAGVLPDDRFPSPLKIAASLVDDIRGYDERLDAARTLAHMRPDLVMPAPAPETKPKLRLADLAAQAATKRAKRALRARKAAKKGTHA